MDAVSRGVEQVLAGFADEWSEAKLARYRRQLAEVVRRELAGLSAPDNHERLQDLSEALTELAVAKLQMERAIDTIGTVFSMNEEAVRVWAGEYGTVPVIDDNGQIAYDATIAALFAIRELEHLASSDANTAP